MFTWLKNLWSAKANPGPAPVPPLLDWVKQYWPGQAAKDHPGPPLSRIRGLLDHGWTACYGDFVFPVVAPCTCCGEPTLVVERLPALCMSNGQRRFDLILTTGCRHLPSAN